MPMKPWMVRPKQSLGIFEGLSGVLDRRDQRQSQQVEAQQRLEDRIAAKQVQDLERQTLEERLRQMRTPAPAKPNRTYDQSRGKVIDLDSVTATDLGFDPKPEPSEPLEQTVGPDGRVVYTPRSKAAGMQAPRPTASDDKTVVQVQREDGTIVYMPRAQAIGQQAPGRSGQGGATKAQRVQALANVSDALDGFERTLDTTGSVVMPGVGKSGLQTEYENVQLQMKELYNLGVLNGPDLELMRRVLNDPTDIKARLLAGGSATEHAQRTKAQIAKVRGIIRRYQSNLSEGMNAMDAAAQAKGPAPKAPSSADPEFDALMAKYAKGGKP